MYDRIQNLNIIELNIKNRLLQISSRKIYFLVVNAKIKVLRTSRGVLFLADSSRVIFATSTRVC
jgi:hypothetical protein